MNQKDYLMLAWAVQKTIKQFDDSVADGYVFETARNIALVLSDDNPRFNYTKFMKACGAEV